MTDAFGGNHAPLRSSTAVLAMDVLCFIEQTASPYSNSQKVRVSQTMFCKL